MKSEKKPNIVFIMADDMGYGDPGCYNPESLIPTPHIDRLAQEGMKFTQAHSGCAVCTPTRYGLMTGRFQWRTNKPHSLVMPYDPPLIPEERFTLPSLLKKAGYTTACVGKWHLGLWYRERMKEGYRRHFTHIEEDIDFEKPLEGGPLDLGFDHFFGTAGCSTSDAPYCYIRGKNTVGIPNIQTPEDMNKEAGVYPGLMVSNWDQDAVDTTFMDEAVRYIEEKGEDDSDQPFFLYYSLSAPHIPWLAPDFCRGLSREGPRGDMNALVDHCVGEVRAALERQNLLEDTLLIFTSDNGPQEGENGHSSTAGLRGLKNTPYEGGHRVPFLVRWPGHVKDNDTCEHPISLNDMMATMADFFDIHLPDQSAEDSITFLPSIFDSKIKAERPCLVAHTGWHVCDIGDFSIQDGPWKLVELNPNPDKDRMEQSYELFNLDSDPFENSDLSQTETDELQRLKSLLDDVKSSQGIRRMSKSET